MNVRSLLLSVMIVSCLILIACSEVKTKTGEFPKSTVVTSRSVQHEEETQEKLPIIDRDYDFTYLEELPEEKRALYEQFLSNGNMNSLKTFTPEEMVLIMMNLIFENKFDKLYAITYNNNELPDKETFIAEYIDYLFDEDIQNYLMYRYYDSISLDKETSTESIAVVQLDIIFGSSHYRKIFSLLKEDDIWKVDIYHYVKEKKAKSEGK
ncbi:hypothetical protein B1B04_08700 [Lysinibacillus sp. KCTC 33748]|uniref:hypothetical protein n=1 Tax=unclassified Lysinibacillus TaxID=2636778 RepID=UPI0009A682CD|nr:MULTISPECIES: hypothetical protein [unclassified Lysinibacillus]OXS74952.1 hypothetical protein B1B04_08700 [Lysinibacillus sp. KCTC 33748]SKB60637.1 hypothetical protein SAMN06295926_104224 [Lysinibacillus sp. AC-3]